MRHASLESTAHDAHGTIVVTLHGDIDATASEALEHAYGAFSAQGPLELDFSGVEYINSTGIALIVGLLARARSESRTVSARGLSAHYREIFEITRLSDFMTILADERSPHNDENGAAT